MKLALSKYWSLLALFALLAVSLISCSNPASADSNGKVTVHLGYFPNVTHAVALVGVQRGTFAQAFGDKVSLKTTTFNAGPALIEALFANSIDIGYVGPNPTINGYTQSKGSALRVIAGAASGGASFIVNPQVIKTPADLANKKLATPQLGNTQDVALRFYLQQHGLKTSDKGGNVQVVPTDNANILNLFKQGKIDGAWVPEPWATRLVDEGKGKVFLDERTLWPNGQFVTTNVVVRKAFYDQHPDIVKKFLEAHVDTVTYIQNNPDDAKKIVNNETKRITGKGLAQEVLDQAYQNLNITYDPLPSALFQAADQAYALGFLKEKPDLKNLYQLNDLNTILKAKGLKPIAVP
ncbi:ABC transporter substrate-binding protein [Ktedonospora formicarum]|uniref:Lipoprotein n=1 Tax=Ktedonospora formicarum TaxID=2778364 RepID=A0A8J3I2Y0_9CHLR|nr:ABC transporter substrate-binding protein [Ktedonospora formicarum]GHO46621.1 lipoprotein [Ktedonospora formicarum]